MGFGEGYHGGKLPFSSCTGGRDYQQVFITGDANLEHLFLLHFSAFYIFYEFQGNHVLTFAPMCYQDKLGEVGGHLKQDQLNAAGWGSVFIFTGLHILESPMKWFSDVGTNVWITWSVV